MQTDIPYQRLYKRADKDEMKWANTQFPLAPALKKDYPEVEKPVRFVGADKRMYKNGDLRFYEEKYIILTAMCLKYLPTRFLKAIQTLH
jgi:hypothetical protein